MTTIFYMEDDECISGAVKEFPEKQGYKVLTFSTIAAGKQALEAECPALVLVGRASKLT